MKVYFNAETDEVITNFRVAEAVVDLCSNRFELDAEAVAKMILVQVDAMKGGAVCTNQQHL